jgi:hypothetical protein
VAIIQKIYLSKFGHILDKFGYILDMKVRGVGGKKRILLYSWLPTGTYHKNLAIEK